MSEAWTVYMLACKDGSYYTGITTDIDRRLREHKNGKGSTFTAARGVEGVAYTEPAPDRSSASSREATIKNLSHTEKQQLANDN
jgi:putative endonuclease